MIRPLYLSEDVQDCIGLICENYRIPASVRMTELLRSFECPSEQSVFLDINVGSRFGVDDAEVLMNLSKGGIKDGKSYRRLRSLMRVRLLDALHEIQELVEDDIRRLGGRA